MSIIASSNFFTARKSRSQYQVERSLRFNSPDSTYLNRTPASAGNRKTWTWSGWIKKSDVSANMGVLLGATDGTNQTVIYVGDGTNPTFRVNFQAGGDPITAAVFRDPSAWYHLVVAVDTTQATASNRVKLYVNGSQITTFSNPDYPTQNLDTAINGTFVHYIGGRHWTTSQYFNGYLTEVNFVDGYAYDSSYFGETDATTGVWKPKRYSGGTYGTNGFFLKFADNSDTTAATLGKDSSGNGNNFTPNNFSVTAGAGNDSLIDSCMSYADGGNGRGNYCTLNPLNASNSFTGKNGNLDFAQSANDQAVTGTTAITSGKWYWEITKNSSQNPEIGIDILNYAQSGRNTASANHNELAFVTNNGTIRNGAGSTETPTGFSSQTGAGTIGIAVDFDNKKIWWSNTSGTWFNSGDPAAGTNAAKDFSALSVASGCIPYVYMGTGASHTCVINFGQRAFAYTPPSGFLALNTQNLPEPSIKKGSSYFDTVLYTGTGSALTPTSSLGFSPDLVWIKSRSAATDNTLYDAVRGVEKRLESNNEDAEVTSDGGLTAFNSNGFTLGTLAQVNTNTATYCAWCWDESATPGFDIVTYTGDGIDGRTVAHNLGVVPSMVIVRPRSTVNNWNVKHASLSSNNVLFLNTTNAQIAPPNSGHIGNLTSSTTFTLKNGGAAIVNVNGNGITYVAYLWSEVAGFSKIGSYTGNGSSDGPFVFCGFRPRWILIKNTAQETDWHLFDTARSTFNLTDKALYPDTSGAEDTLTNNTLDILSNGFKLRTSGNSTNGSTNTLIFMAFAESPFKFALAR